MTSLHGARAAVVWVALLVACGDSATPGSGPAANCIESVRLESPEGLEGPVFELRAITPEGCARLEEPLAAFNWFSFDDPRAYAAYSADVTRVLASIGARVLVGGGRIETLESPGGEPVTGGSYVHESLGIPLYPSAAGFLGMITSPEFQAIVANRQAGARESDYIFGLQHCLVGCDTEVPAIGTDAAPLLLHIFRYEGEDVEGAIRDLADRDGPEVVYAGRTVAEIRVLVGGTNLNDQNSPWGDGVMIYRLDSAEAARAWIEGDTFETFRRNTAEDVIVLLGLPVIAS